MPARISIKIEEKGVIQFLLESIADIMIDIIRKLNDLLNNLLNIIRVGSNRPKKSSISFSFSPYSTKRSRLGELQARLKRDK